MELETKIYWMIPFLSIPNFPPWVVGKPLVPCYFIFGDSLIDNGNNNLLNTTAKANYWPNGIDFRYGSTGRFCNGRTMVDVYAELLGFKDYIPPFAQAKGIHVLRGVNYASAGSGIRNETGDFFGDRICFNQQLNNFKTTISQIADILGGKDLAANYLNKCLYHVGIGNNDFLCNYFVPEYFSTGSEYNQPVHWNPYQSILESIMGLQTLYQYGARKIVIAGLAQGGCMPFELARNSSDGRTCVQSINDAMQLFNRKLKKLVYDLNENLKDAKFIYIDTPKLFQDLYDNPSTYGFKVTNFACCGLGKNNAQMQCSFGYIPCLNRNEFLFWDSYHPTEAANVIVARKSFSTQMPPQYSHPYGIHHLAKL